MQGWTISDTLIMGAYILGIVTFGSLFARSQKNIGDFFLAGRSFKWLPIALSIIAADLSAISYMGAPAMVFQHDLRYSLTIFILPFVAVFAAILIVRIFYRLSVFTVNEYLEHRYGVAVRTLAAVLFLLTRGGWLATVISTPALALSVVTGVNLWVCVVVFGALTTIYACLGGIEGVIWCDVIHFFVLVGGIVLALVFMLRDFGWDIVGVWRIASEQGHTTMFSLDMSLNAEFSIWGIIGMAIVVNMGSYGVDQVVVQRYLTAKSLREVIKSAVGQSLLVVPVIYSLYLVGVGLVAYYHQHPEMMQSLLSLNPDNVKEAQDRVFPHFITYGLPAGISGLVIAGIMAATMSSVDSGVNSLSTVAVMDIYKRFFHHARKDEHHYLRAARLGTLVVGTAATVAALYVGQLGSILEIIGKISGFLVGPTVAMFLLGVLSRRANTPGVLLGTFAGLGVLAVVVRYTSVFWLWYGPIGLVASLAMGYLFSLPFPPATDQQLLKTVAADGRTSVT